MKSSRGETKSMVVLIDTNVIIDYFQKRDDYLAAEKIIDDYCTNGKID